MEPGDAERAVAPFGGAETGYDVEAASGAPAQASATLAASKQQVDASCCRLLSILGFDLSKRHNLVALDDQTIAMAAGNNVLLLDLATLQQRYLPARDGGGIGAVALHPKRSCFAVAEKCREHAPSIYIYEWPSLALLATLPSGTEVAYSAAQFDSSGDLLAAVGSAPDYMLTLWSWREGQVVLRSKAFSQEVYCVRFSPYFTGRLVTSGTGHIRFWRMASTFTGLKLQGALGKFGAVELSDVAAFVELPDGKVLSGSESGALLLWDAGMIKAMITRQGGAPCHSGSVAVLLHDEATNYILSGGADNVLRLWELSRLNVEPQEAVGSNGSGGGEGGSGVGGASSCQSVEVKPSVEVTLPAGVHVRSLLWLDRRTWLVADDAGGILQIKVPLNLLDASAYSSVRLFSCHAGAVVGLETLPDCHVAITAGADGTVRALDYSSSTILQSRSFNAAATSMALLPAGGRRCCLAVGFKGGVVRCLQRCSDGWLLLGAHKPHTAGIVAVTVSADGRRAATVAADGTAFFFDTPSPEQWRPLGFCRLPGGTPTCACWVNGGTHLLAGCAMGQVVEVQAPGANIDNSRTYELQLAMRIQHIKLRRRILGHQQSSSDTVSLSASTSVLKSSPQESVGASPRDGLLGTLTDSQALDETSVVPITWLQCPADRAGCFHACLGGQAAGHVWECSFDRAQPFSFCPTIATAPTNMITASPSGHYRLLGSADGVVRVEPVGGSLGASDARYWQASVHDMQSGSVRHLAMSFDDSCFLSAAQDGSLVVLQNGLPGAPGGQQPGQAPPLAPMLSAGVEAAQDLGNGALSFEEGRQAAVADALATQAAEAKQGLRSEFEAVRSELRQLLATNAARPAGQRLPRSAFSIDPGLMGLVEAERQRKLEDARAQVAWNAEVAANLLQKLRSFFSSQLAATNFVLHPVQSAGGHAVATLATPQLPPEVQAEIDAAAVLGRPSDEDSSGSTASQLSRQAQGVAMQQQKSVTHRAAVGVDGSEGGGQLGGTSSLPAVMSKANLRRAARKERDARWAALRASKPDDAFEAPEDVEALRVAAATIGDLKLRSAPDYIPDKEQRMTPLKKRHQMAQLSRHVSRALESFNADLNSLRGEKHIMLQRLAANMAQLNAVNAQLGIPEFESEVSMLPDEEPDERRNCVTSDQIREHVDRKKAEQQRKAGGPSAGGLGGFAAVGGAAGAANSTEAKSKPAGDGPAGSSAQRAAAKTAVGSQPASAALRPAGSATAAASVAPLSDLEAAEVQAQHRRLEVVREGLLWEKNELRTVFDGALDRINQRRLQLACDISSCQARQLVHYQGLLLLKEFDKRELVLLAMSSAKGEERDDLQAKLSDLGRQIDAKKAEADSVAAAKAAVVAEFDAQVPEKHPFRDALTHIFNRKIKRSSKRAGASPADDSDDDDDDDDLDVGDEDEGADDAEDEDDSIEVCPPGCEQALYDKVCELREQRLDEEEAAADVAKHAEAIKKDREVLDKKGRLIDQSLNAINQDMLEFQREKQGRLNQVLLEVALRAHQVQHLTEQQQLPSGDLSQVLVIAESSLDKLSARIKGLDDEKAGLRVAQKDLRRQHVQLAEEKAAKDAHLVEQQARCRDVQMLKFGQEIDVSLLDTIGVRNHAAEDLKHALKRQEHTQVEELQDLEAQAAMHTRELLVLTKTNTDALNTVSDLTRSQRGLEAEVLSHKAGLSDDELQSRRSAVAERHALVTAVNTHANTLQQLRSKIDALRRKDTVLYT